MEAERKASTWFDLIGTIIIIEMFMFCLLIFKYSAKVKHAVLFPPLWLRNATVTPGKINICCTLSCFYDY